MAYALCNRFGFHEQARRDRLHALGLSFAEGHHAALLHDMVIGPRVDKIVAGFYNHMLGVEDFLNIFARGYDIEKLKQTQTAYLLSLGQDFGTAEYFEERLRVGVTHAKVGVPLSLYECAYAVLKDNIVQAVPDSIRGDAEEFQGLISFLMRITALDMSLAIETYHESRVKTLERALKSLAQLDAELRHKVATDALTGVASHGQSLSALGRAIQQAHRNGTPLCICMVDLDHFKNVNDSFGHQVGDDVLCDIAGRMQGAVRSFDTVGRYGGEEFLIIMDNASRETAQEIAERVRYRVSASPVKTRSVEVRVTVSLGLAILQPEDDVDSLIKRADEALYKAKHEGRNRVVFPATESG